MVITNKYIKIRPGDRHHPNTIVNYIKNSVPEIIEKYESTDDSIKRRILIDCFVIKYITSDRYLLEDISELDIGYYDPDMDKYIDTVDIKIYDVLFTSDLEHMVYNSVVYVLDVLVNTDGNFSYKMDIIIGGIKYNIDWTSRDEAAEYLDYIENTLGYINSITIDRV